VGYLRRVPSAILAARAVMEYTTHTLLAGDGATALSTTFGGQNATNLTGAVAAGMYAAWRDSACQPNYYSPAVVGANVSCGPYSPLPMPTATPLPQALHAGPGGDGGAAAAALARARSLARPHRVRAWATERNHDTLGLCALDVAGSLTAVVTSNGAGHKVAGRVGDAPVIGAGGYASDESRGCAAATGDGDITQRFLPAFVATEAMRRGAAPLAACEEAVRRIMSKVSVFSIGIVCLNSDGDYAAAAHGWGGDGFKFCVRSPLLNGTHCENVQSLV
jgi:N4-(beta-N-acetylglucosaminyl)-L-asparaginase